MKKCEVCNKDFIPHGQYKGRERNYCSMICYRKHQDTMVELTCHYCHNTFKTRGKYKNRKFCSSKCYQAGKLAISKTITEPCLNCGKLIKKYNYQKEKCKFCSRHCMSQYCQSTSVLHQDIFENIDTIEKAYALGLIASDGSVLNGNKINLTMCDLDAIEFFAHLIGYQNKISCTKSNNLRHQNAYTINITSSKMYNDLLKLNIVPRKSFIEDLYPPKIVSKLQYAFWAGFIDGDGSIGIKNHKYGKYVRISIVAKSEVYIREFGLFLAENNISSSIRKDRNIFTISFGGKQTAEQIYHLFYRDEIGMERKRCKLRNYVKDMQNTMN